MRRGLFPISLVVALSIILSSFPGPIRSSTAQTISKNDTSLLALFNTSSAVRAVVELDSEPVVTREMKRLRAGESASRMDFESTDARGYESTLMRQQEEFKARASSVSPGMRVVTQLSRLANAISIEAAGYEMAQIAMLPEVRRLEPVREVRATLSASVPMIEAPALWERLGGASVAGQGIEIAITDSGVDISNPMFSDEGMTAPAGFPRGELSFTNNKVIVAKAFLNPNSSPADENGHGTAVAAIAAGRLDVSTPIGMMSGVAPRAFIGNYRVLDSEGRGTDDLLARAIEEAVKDGFDVVNVSLGHDAFSPTDFISRVVESAVAAGVVVVAAAGNSGERGLSTITSPGIAPSAITVGAVTNAHSVGPMVSVAGPEPVPPEIAAIRATVGVGGPGAFTEALGPLSYLDVNSIDGIGRACGPLVSGSLAQKIGLIERGDCPFASKVNAATAAGASAAIVFNRESGTVTDGGDSLVLMDVKDTAIRSVFVGRTGGLALREWLKQHAAASVRVSPAGSFTATADVVAPFSAKGPTFGGVLKPDIVAPGVSIYSAAIKQPNAFGITDPSGFKAENGTSQAAPHISGAAALLKQLNPTWSPEQIKSALMNSAVDSVFTGTDRSTRASLFEAGAGRVDLSRAMSVGATLSPCSISFGVKTLKKKARLSADLRITNVTDETITYAVSAELLDPDSNVSATPSTSSITLARGGASLVSLTIQAAKRAERRTYNGVVHVVDSRGSALRVPFWVRFIKK